MRDEDVLTEERFRALGAKPGPTGTDLAVGPFRWDEGRELVVLETRRGGYPITHVGQARRICRELGVRLAGEG